MKVLIFLGVFMAFNFAFAGDLNNKLVSQHWDGPEDIIKLIEKNQIDVCKTLTDLEKSYKGQAFVIRRILKVWSLTKCAAKPKIALKYLGASNIPLLYDGILLASTLPESEKKKLNSKILQIKREYSNDKLIMSGLDQFFKKKK